MLQSSPNCSFLSCHEVLHKYLGICIPTLSKLPTLLSVRKTKCNFLLIIQSVKICLVVVFKLLVMSLLSVLLVLYLHLYTIFRWFPTSFKKREKLICAVFFSGIACQQPVGEMEISSLCLSPPCKRRYFMVYRQSIQWRPDFSSHVFGWLRASICRPWLCVTVVILLFNPYRYLAVVGHILTHVVSCLCYERRKLSSTAVPGILPGEADEPVNLLLSMQRCNFVAPTSPPAVLPTSCTATVWHRVSLPSCFCQGCVWAVDLRCLMQGMGRVQVGSLLPPFPPHPCALIQIRQGCIHTMTSCGQVCELGMPLLCSTRSPRVIATSNMSPIEKKRNLTTGYMS